MKYLIDQSGKIEEALKMTDGRLRECFSTLVNAQPWSVKKSYHLQKRKSR